MKARGKRETGGWHRTSRIPLRMGKPILSGEFEVPVRVGTGRSSELKKLRDPTVYPDISLPYRGWEVTKVKSFFSR